MKSDEDAIQKKTRKKFLREMKNGSKVFLFVLFFATVSLPDDDLIFACDSQEEDAMIRQVK